METSRPTLLMLKGDISISHIVRDTDQNCIDTFSKEMFCNIAFDQYNAILKLTATAKQGINIFSLKIWLDRVYHICG